MYVSSVSIMFTDVISIHHLVLGTTTIISVFYTCDIDIYVFDNYI